MLRTWLLALLLPLALACTVVPSTTDVGGRGLDQAENSSASLDEAEELARKEKREAERAERRLAREEATAERERKRERDREERRIREEERREASDRRREESLKRLNREDPDGGDQTSGTPQPENETPEVDYSAYDDLLDYYETLGDTDAVPTLFSGDDSIGVDPHPALDLSEQGTIAFLIEIGWRGDLGAPPGLLANADEQSLRWGVYLYPDAGGLAMLGSADEVATLDFDFEAGESYHIVLVTQGSSTTAYIDGVARGTLDTGYGIARGLPLDVGSGFIGTLGDVRLWSRALDAGEAEAVAQQSLEIMAQDVEPVPEQAELASLVPTGVAADLLFYSITTRGGAEFFMSNSP